MKRSAPRKQWEWSSYGKPKSGAMRVSVCRHQTLGAISTCWKWTVGEWRLGGMARGQGGRPWLAGAQRAA